MHNNEFALLHCLQSVRVTRAPGAEGASSPDAEQIISDAISDATSEGGDARGDWLSRIDREQFFASGLQRASQAGGEMQAELAATNGFKRDENGAWKMVMHQAGTTLPGVNLLK